MQIRVYYEDTDTGGIVYHSNYLNFCERARSETFFQEGLSPDMASGGFVVKKITANYLKPAKLGDLLEVKSSLKLIKSASFVLIQRVYKDNVKLFEAEIVLAYINREGYPQKFEDELRELIISLFNS
ncbi:MAG: YbgC/FadM family acyl-CoA thioesterase [Thiovulaceae bacterium]|nr:YbgC/FadM family acyl-CoA thioesterase [Sulfurimonadaceae bacterium]MCW9027218.1 YbgC/FadM family acyl-CoA thioesterase [Sulfurimonadaceae bacterium]